MPVLTSLLHHLTCLRELKHVIYPIPVNCYRQWDVHDSLDQRQLAEVQAQLKATKAPSVLLEGLICRDTCKIVLFTETSSG